MEKSYIYAVENKSFNSEAEMINYIMKKHTRVETKNTMSTEIVSKLNDAFPFAKISVEQKGNADKYSINMNWEDYGETAFQFYMGGSDAYAINFDNVDQAINYYMRFYNIIREIEYKLSVKHNLDDFKVEGVYQYPCEDIPECIHFTVNLDGNKYYESYYYNVNSVDEFVDSFDSYFEDTFEGDLEELKIDDYDTKLYVDKKPLENILKRAKRIRIEILE